MTERRRALNERQRRFVAEYLVDFNATRAAIRAGYPAKTARCYSWHLKRHPGIAAAINDGRPARERLMSITRDKVVQEYMRIAFADMRDFLDWTATGPRAKKREEVTDDQAAAIAELRIEKTGQMLIKLHDKRRALDQIVRLLGLTKAPPPPSDAPSIESGLSARELLRQRLAALAEKGDKVL